MSNKPITEEQVDRLIESLPPMYDKDFKQSFKNCINQTRNQAFKEVLDNDLVKMKHPLMRKLRATIKELGENK